MNVTDELTGDADKGLCHYLSSNVGVQRYVQTDGEALLQAINTYVGMVKDGKQKEADAYADECRKKSQLINVQYSMPNKEGREFAIELYKLEAYMGHTTAFTSKWIKDHIIGVYGGVSE
jgi:hypothetical protein